MEKAREFLEKNAAGEQSDTVSQLTFPPHKPHQESSFWEYLVLRGVRVDQIKPGRISCSFRVPPRITDANGNLSNGAIASLVDEIGAAVVHEKDMPMDVSIDMPIAFVSSAKVNDELEIISRRLGKLGGYAGTIVLIRNKMTGEVVAEGRHSLFSKHASKM